MAFEKVYHYGTPKSGIPLENVLIDSFMWDFDNQDITPVDITTKIPLESDDPMKIASFDVESDEWVLVDNPYQHFIHKYVSSMSFENKNPVQINNNGTTSFDSLKYNPSDYPNEWLVKSDEISDRDTSKSRVLLGVYCNQVWSDADSKFIFAEPFTEDVRSYKKNEINHKCPELIRVMTSDVLGSTHYYDFTEIDRQNLNDAIDYLKASGESSVGYRCGEVIDGSIVKSNKPHTLAQLEELNTQFQKYKINLLNACDLLKRKCDELTDKEDIYYLDYSDYESIVDGSFIPYTERDSYKIPEWRKKSRDAIDYEKIYYSILEREGLK